MLFYVKCFFRNLQYGSYLVVFEFVDVDQVEYLVDQFFIVVFFDDVLWVELVFDVLEQDFIQVFIFGQVVGVFLVRFEFSGRGFGDDVVRDDFFFLVDVVVKFEDFCFVKVVNNGQFVVYIVIEGVVVNSYFIFIGCIEEDIIKFIGQGYEQVILGVGLYVFFGDIEFGGLKVGFECFYEIVVDWFDGDDVVGCVQVFCQFLGIYD